jgi:hypothetical protein
MMLGRSVAQRILATPVLAGHQVAQFGAGLSAAIPVLVTKAKHLQGTLSIKRRAG